jgi:epoxyqueuosine reductase QueG
MVADINAQFDKLVRKAEVDRIGLVRLEDWKDTLIYRQAVDLLPDAKSVFVLAMEIFAEVVVYLSSRAQVGEMALRDLFNSNTNLVNGLLNRDAYDIVKELHKIGYKGLVLPATGAPFDNRFLESPFSYKDAALAAGLGIIGRHSLLLTLEYGPRVRLACVITNAPLESAGHIDRESPCIACGGACIKICPAGAIKLPEENEIYNFDKYTCYTYINATGTCAECIKVCPAGKPLSN